MSNGARAIQAFSARIIAAAIGMLAGVIVARTLGPTGKGAYSAVQTLLSVPVAVTMGVGSAMQFLLAHERLRLRTLIVPLAVIFGALTLLGLGAACVYAAREGWTAPVVAFVVALPAAIILSWQPAFYVAMERLRTLNLQVIFQALLTLLLLAGLCLATHTGIAGALAALVIANYVFALAVVVDGLRLSGGAEVSNARATTWRIISFGAQSSLNSVLGMLNYRIDSLILVAMLGLNAFGLYSIAINLGQMLFLLLRPMNLAVGREISAADPERSAQLTADTIRFGFLISLACAAVAFVFGPSAIHFVYGGRFDAAGLPLRLLLPGILVFASAGTFASYFIFQLGRPIIVTWINVVMIAVQTAACFIFVPRYGLAGAAFSSTVTYVLGAAVNSWVFVRSSGGTLADLWLPRPRDATRLMQLTASALRPRHVQGASFAADGFSGSLAKILKS